MADWTPEKGERIKVVGISPYDGTYGTVVDFTGSGLCRVLMDRDGLVIGAAGWNIRQLHELEALASEAPSQMSPMRTALRDIRAKAQTKGGAAGQAYYDAAALVERAMKAQGIK